MAIVIAPDLTLRAERADDVGLVRALYRDGRMGELASVPWPQAAKHAFLDDQFRLQSAHFAGAYPAADRWIVQQDEQVIGRLYVDRQPLTWQLIEIGIVGATRGRGVGARLIGWLAEQAASAGASALELQVAHDNVRAAVLYGRLGFVASGEGSATHRPMRLVLS